MYSYFYLYVERIALIGVEWKEYKKVVKKDSKSMSYSLVFN